MTTRQEPIDKLNIDSVLIKDIIERPCIPDLLPRDYEHSDYVYNINQLNKCVRFLYTKYGLMGKTK